VGFKSEDTVVWSKRTDAGTIGAFNPVNAAVQKLLQINWHDPRKCAFNRFGWLRHSILNVIAGRTLVVILLFLVLFRLACLSSTCRLHWKRIVARSISVNNAKGIATEHEKLGGLL
jgi:hypothetical protein